MDTQMFKDVLSYFATGVTIVTTRNGDKHHGLTVSSFCSVSLDPPLVLVCISKSASSHDIIANSKIFAINILSAEQEALSRRFADPDLQSYERFEGIPFSLGHTGAAILPDILGYLDCEVYAAYEGGDHTIFVGRVVDCATGSASRPLVYYRRGYRHLPPDRTEPLR